MSNHTVTPAAIRLFNPALEDAGYCLHQPQHSYFIIEGRRYSAGFAKDARIETGGEIVPGWSGWLNAAPTLIATSYPTEDRTSAAVGDLIAGPDGEIFRIVPNPRSRSIHDLDRYLLQLLSPAANLG